MSFAGNAGNGTTGLRAPILPQTSAHFPAAEMPYAHIASWESSVAPWFAWVQLPRGACGGRQNEQKRNRIHHRGVQQTGVFRYPYRGPLLPPGERIPVVKGSQTRDGDRHLPLDYGSHVFDRLEEGISIIGANRAAVQLRHAPISQIGGAHTRRTCT
jgi:hypothetical protein